jgi:hypothetical protein
MGAVCMSRIIEDDDGRRVILHDDGQYEEVDNGGCFIATSAYGTPFCAELDVLRAWRDSIQGSFFGGLFVRTYYKISPPVASFIADKPKLRKLVRSSLRPFVEYLKKQQ